MQYEFTLIVDEDATDARYADALFEAGEGDYVAEGGPRGNLVHVFQEAATLPRSLVVAIRMIEGTGLHVLGVRSDNLVTLQDIADRTGRVAESVRLLAKGRRGPGGFPAPELPGKPAFYSWPEVLRWFAENYGADDGSEFDRELAAADHLVRARRLLAGDENRAEMAQLIEA